MKLYIVKNTSIYYLSSIILVVTAFVPLVDSFNTTIVNMVRLIGAVGILFSLINKKNISFNMVVILGLSLIVNFIFFIHVWNNYTTFFNFMSRSMLCWVYGLAGLCFINSDEKSKDEFLNILSVLIVFTCICSIIGAIRNPDIIRFTGTGGIEKAHEKQMVYRRNIASWNTIYSMVFTMPVWVEIYFKTKNVRYLFTAIIIFITIMYSQITFALIFVAIILFMMYLKYRVKRKILIGSLAIALAGTTYIIRRKAIEILIVLFDNVGLTMLRTRMYQLKVSMDTGALYGTGDVRFELYRRSLSAFIKNPVLGYDVKRGQGSAIGMHSQLFDMLGGTGMIGMILVVIAFYMLFKLTRRHIYNRRVMFAYYLNLGVLMMFIVVNPIWSSPASFFGVFSMPLFLTTTNIQNLKLVKSRCDRSCE